MKFVVGHGNQGLYLYAPMECENFRSGECLVASRLAGIRVVFDQRACAVCVKQDNPIAENKVTHDIASLALRKMGREKEANALLAYQPRGGNGMGAAFVRALPWVDAANPGCDCASYIHLMNQWGPEKCIEKRDSLVRWFGKVAQTLGMAATAEELELAIFRAADECRAHTRDDAAVGQWPFVWTYWAGGAVGEELRYSIRSVLHHHPQARVIVVGDRPDWYHGEFIAKPRIKRTPFHAFRDCYSKLLLVAEQVPQFIWMMDDIYWIKPFSIAEAAVPKYVRHVSQQRFHAWRPKNTWAKTRAHAYRWLLEQGRPTYDFAAHLPQPIVADSFLAMERELQLMTGQYRNWECCYLNTYHAAGAEDWGRRFLRVTRTRESIETKHKILNHIHSQYRGAVERFLAATFPEPCSVEITQ